jgi:NAD(P)-dependent dehydrogenase (short-subunit alcohol dehydrogenase family)
MGSQFRLDGKRVLVTGASSGIGHSIAVAASNLGAEIVACGRDNNRLEATIGSLRAAPGHTMIVADLTLDEDLNRLVAEAGNLHGIVHAAGIKGPAPIRVVTRKFLDERFNANYFAPVLLSQRLLAENRISNGGSILFLASIAAHTGTHGMSVYSATKASLVVTAKCLALEVARRSIRVNCLSPGVVRTPIFDGFEEKWLNDMEKRYPLGLGTPEDVANASVFFLADASRWITGQTLIMDGACPWI